MRKSAFTFCFDTMSCCFQNTLSMLKWTRKCFILKKLCSSEQRQRRLLLWMREITICSQLTGSLQCSCVNNDQSVWAEKVEVVWHYFSIIKKRSAWTVFDMYVAMRHFCALCQINSDNAVHLHSMCYLLQTHWFYSVH